MREPVTVACVQAEPAILDREATLDKVAALTAEAAGKGASLVVFPETFVPAYPSSAWAKRLAGWGDEEAKAAFALLARESVSVPGPAGDHDRGIEGEVVFDIDQQSFERRPMRIVLVFGAPNVLVEVFLLIRCVLPRQKHFFLQIEDFIKRQSGKFDREPL